MAQFCWTNSVGVRIAPAGSVLLFCAPVHNALIGPWGVKSPKTPPPFSIPQGDPKIDPAGGHLGNVAAQRWHFGVETLKKNAQVPKVPKFDSTGGP